MAPKIRYTAIPASLWASDSPFLDLSGKAQLLYIRLWTSEARNAAGFVPLQPTLWAKSNSTASAASVTGACEELCAAQWLMVDYDAELAWLCGFIEEDTFNNPNQYVSALGAIRTCSSWMLRDAAWKEIQRLGLPPVKPGKPEAQRRMQARMQRAWDGLAERMYANPKGDRRGFDTPSKVSSVNAHAHVGEDAGADDPGTEPGLLCSSAGCQRPVGPDGRRCEQCAKAAKP
jgi:hypothetical protein